MYETCEGITVIDIRYMGNLIIQTVRAERMPPEPDGVLAFTFTMQAIENLRSPAVATEDFIMQRLRMAGFTVIEPPDLVAIHYHYEFDRDKSGVIGKVESYIPWNLRYEWRPTEVKVRDICANCGCSIHIARTLTGPAIRNGRYDVWVHVDSGFNPCWMRVNGTEIEGSPRAQPKE